MGMLEVVVSVVDVCRTVTGRAIAVECDGKFSNVSVLTVTVALDS